MKHLSEILEIDTSRLHFCFVISHIFQTEDLVLRAEKRALCDCMPASSLR